MGTGQGKLDRDLVVDNALLKPKYELEEAGGAVPVFATLSPMLGCASFGLSFVIPPGDGASIGMSFTGGGGGAFTLSSAILATSRSFLESCYIFLPGNAGGSGNAEGWYYGEFTSDTAGTVYAEKYSEGSPVVPGTKTPFPGSPAGRITQTVSEITGPTGWTLPEKSIGNSGVVLMRATVIGTTAGTKTVRWKIGGQDAAFAALTSQPVGQLEWYIQALGRNGYFFRGRQSAITGVVNSVQSALSSNRMSLDTSISNPVSLTLQITENTSGLIVVGGSVSYSWGN